MIRTALVFSSSQIDLVRVDPDSKQLVVAKSQALPTEAIARGKVQNKELVSSVLKELTKELPNKLNKLILVIPEDAVISKSLELPKLKLEEINEAIQFAAEEYLPFKLDEAVLDWKMISADKQNHILFQAVEKSIIHDYIDQVRDLSFDVSVVETPALAMLQLCDCKGITRILIHVGIKEAVLTLARGCEVIATSVVNYHSKLNEAITSTILSMMAYYKDFEVKSLVIGGIGLTQSLVKQMSVLHIPIGGFNLPITVAPVIANNYLLGISAAVRDITPPSDQQTINLLPADIVTQQSSKSTLAMLNFIVWFLNLGSLIIISILGATWWWLQKEEQSVKANKQQTTPANVQIIEAAKKTNDLASLAIQLDSYDQFPLELINSINTLQKKGIKIAQINLRLVEKKGEVVGLADDRESLLTFKQSLEEVKDISAVALPASSFVEQSQIPFQLNFNLAGAETENKNKVIKIKQ